MAHTQGKKHQANLARRAAKEKSDEPGSSAIAPKPNVDIRKFVKIGELLSNYFFNQGLIHKYINWKKGRPGYKVTKQRDPDTKQQSLLFQIDYPEIMDNLTPRHRFMSAYEQRIEPPDKKFQYLLFAAEPYETIAFKVPSREIDKTDNKFWTHWNSEAKQFFLQLSFKCEREGMFMGQMSNQTVMLTQQMSTQQGYIINI